MKRREMLEDCYARLPEKFKAYQMVYSISVYYDISEARATNMLKAMALFGWIMNGDLGWFIKLRKAEQKKFDESDLPEFTTESAKDAPQEALQEDAKDKIQPQDVC